MLNHQLLNNVKKHVKAVIKRIASIVKTYCKKSYCVNISHTEMHLANCCAT